MWGFTSVDGPCPGEVGFALGMKVDIKDNEALGCEFLRRIGGVRTVAGWSKSDSFGDTGPTGLLTNWTRNRSPKDLEDC